MQITVEERTPARAAEPDERRLGPDDWVIQTRGEQDNNTPWSGIVQTAWFA